jgi:DNA-binding NarL/FixJ family response regulator
MLTPEFEVVATAADGLSALDLIRCYKPDLAVLDLSMPGISGIEVIAELARAYQNTPVVICSIMTDSEVVEAARQAGASAYVFKTHVERELIPAMKLALDKNRLNPPFQMNA